MSVVTPLTHSHVNSALTHSDRQPRRPAYSPPTATQQVTLRAPISCVGVGLHSGLDVRLTLRPAAPGTGIVFKRSDVDEDKSLIHATYDAVIDTQLCTKIANKQGVSVGTIEHLMAALAALAVDNVVIVLDGPEVPIMDGSAAPFIFLIEAVGLETQAAERRYIKVLEPVEITMDGKTARLEPFDGFEIDFSIAFDSAAIGQQSLQHQVSSTSFKNDIARARTFGFAHEVRQLQAMGLAKGGSLENAVVVDGDTVLNEEGLRFHNEFVRHKVLDAVGDLFLAGAPLKARYTAHKAGHQVNNAILHALFARPDAWCWVTEPEAVAQSNIVSFPTISQTNDGYGLSQAASMPPASRTSAPRVYAAAE